MNGKQGIVLAVALVALVGIGATLIISMGSPQSRTTTAAVPGNPPPLQNPNEVGSLPSDTSTAGNAGNATGNQSQPAASSGGTTGGLYG